ncbi:MAG: hypothetical protein V1720_05725 [bacterium]
MKSKILTRLLLAGTVFILFSCKEYHITTKINEDGSCERIIIIKSDSQSGEDYDSMFPFDKSWKKTTSQNPDDSLKYVETYSKKFDSVEDLNRWLKKNSLLKTEASLEKKFRWFYTYYTYTETYKKTNPFKQLPFEDYLSKEEIEKLYAGDINEDLSKKLDRYGAACMLNELFDSLAVEMKNFSELNPELLKQNEEEISNVLSSGGDELQAFMEELESIYKTKTIWELKDEIVRIKTAIENKAEALWKIQSSFSNDIIMPGLLLETNAKNINGNKLTWKFEAVHFTYVDYKMTAQSRAANDWAMILTAVLVVLFIMAIIYAAFKRKKNVV